MIKRGVRQTAMNTPQYKKWRKAVVERDRYICRLCWSTEEIEAHHILYWSEYPESRFDTNNGLTLCRECHCAVHGKLYTKER